MTGHPKAPRRDDDAAEAWELLVELTMHNRPRWMAIYAEYDLSPPQFFALRRLHMHGTSPMSELADFLACDRSNVTGIVDRLEARGLVERGASPIDRRVKLLRTTRTSLQQVGERMMHPPDGLAALTAGPASPARPAAPGARRRAGCRHARNPGGADTCRLTSGRLRRMSDRGFRRLVFAIFVGSGTLHFINPKMYEAIVPEGIPAHEAVLVSGAAEIAGGLGVIIPPTRRAARWGSRGNSPLFSGELQPWR